MHWLGYYWRRSPSEKREVSRVYPALETLIIVFSISDKQPQDCWLIIVSTDIFLNSNNSVSQSAHTVVHVSLNCILQNIYCLVDMFPSPSKHKHMWITVSALNMINIIITTDLNVTVRTANLVQDRRSEEVGRVKYLLSAERYLTRQFQDGHVFKVAISERIPHSYSPTG